MHKDTVGQEKSNELIKEHASLNTGHDHPCSIHENPDPEENQTWMFLEHIGVAIKVLSELFVLSLEEVFLFFLLDLFGFFWRESLHDTLVLDLFFFAGTFEQDGLERGPEHLQIFDIILGCVADIHHDILIVRLESFFGVVNVQDFYNNIAADFPTIVIVQLDLMLLFFLILDRPKIVVMIPDRLLVRAIFI